MSAGEDPTHARPWTRHLAALLAAGVLVAGCSSTGASLPPASPTPASPTPPPPTSTASTPTVPPSVVPSATSNPSTGWQAVPDQLALQGVAFRTVVRTGQRFVAIGEAADRVVALDSVDGLAWHRGADLGVKENVSVWALAAGPRGLVAVGTISFRPASWTSADGLAWTAQTEPFPMPALGTDTATVTGIIANGDGWLAVGREDPACETLCGRDPVRALVWTSRDGLAWTRVADQPSLEGGGLSSIARTDRGFVAGGIDARHAAVWVSAEGRTWSRVPDEPLFHPQPETDPWAAVAMSPMASGHGIVVGFATAFGVGEGGAPTAVAWWTADGRSWTVAPVPDASPDYANSVASVIDGFLATGVGWRVDDWLEIVWQSIDGRTWVKVPAGATPDGFDPVAVAASSTVEIAVGSRGTTTHAWWRPVR